MSEDAGVKAPVTRLRRRLSVESEEMKSIGNTTPTKKKGGRLATKPQLDLIEEIDADQITKRSTRKTAAKNVTELIEEKPMTPSRRSARIRSNTSILSETPPALDTPRSKRAAARRTSQAGSDNDAPLTPVRQTRRTRKDSTSSIDKQVDKVGNKTSATPEIIVEEKETHDDSNTKEKSVSKSPKHRGRGGKKNDISKSPNGILNDIEVKIIMDLNTSTNKENQHIHVESSESMTQTLSANNSENKDTITDNDIKAEYSEILTENLDAKSKRITSILHKITSAIENSKTFKSKRHRTKSVSAIGTNKSNESSFLSDTEISKKKRKNKSLTPHVGDIYLHNNENSNKRNNKSLESLCDTDEHHMVKNTVSYSKEHKESEDKNETKLRNTSKSSINESMTINEEPLNSSVSKTGWKKNIINQLQTEEIADSKDNNDYVSPIKCFENTPSKDIQSVVFIEDDSDSNACNNDVRPACHIDSEDQCVPVVKHDDQNNSNEQVPNDNSYEPMDIDESIQQNSSIITSMKNSPTVLKMLETKEDSISVDSNNDCNKSKRQSLSIVESHNEKSMCESKNTRLISQIKDASCNEVDEKLLTVNNKEQLSKSINIPDKIKTKKAEGKKLSLDYSTSTPLQQKSMKKLGVPMDNSLFSPENGNTAKIESVNREKLKKNLENSKEETNIENDDDSDDSDGSGSEVTKTQNELIDDEAEEVSEDYQSGDSQDEDEKQYEEENEIVEKGETLDTEEEFSDNTDYERDSFVVSSDEEDNELLSGSGDDLSTGDNELSMSAKSKKKYNEKKNKEQKKASREMYEARHQLDISNEKVQTSKYKKNKRQRLDSSSSDSDEEITAQPKKNNRQRIDSSQDLSQIKSDDNETMMKKKKKNRLSGSVSGDSILNEQEITICNKIELEDKDPIAIAIKNEPKTPQKHNKLSAVLIHENIEEINIDQNASIMKPNETTDPLQSTMQRDDEESSSGDDNNEIINNYNSILENLNNTRDVKSHDISLNINKKQKKVKEPIVDQLNLTQTKSKKNKKKTIEIDLGVSLELGSQRTENGNKVPVDKEDDDVSDSIDMRLLFTEDSNDSESTNIDKTKEVNAENIIKDTNYIPLKKTEAKTNLLEDVDTTFEVNNSTHLNDSKNKNKKRKSSQNTSEENTPSNVSEKNEASFFIDKIGTRFDMDESLSTSLHNSTKKNKKRSTEYDSNLVEAKESPNSDEEIVAKKTGKKNDNTETQDDIENISDTADVLIKTTPQSGKKKQKGKTSLNVTDIEENDIAPDESTFTPKTPQSGKKKNKPVISLDESTTVCNIQEDKEQEIFELKATSSDKKKKKGKKSLTDIQNESHVCETIDYPTEITQSDKKRKSSHSNIDTNDIIPSELNNADADESPLEVSYQSNKKDKSGLESQPAENLVVNDTSLNASKNSAKKRKRKHSATTDENILLESVKEKYKSENLNEPLAGNQSKKRKLNNNTEELSTQDKDITKHSKELSNVETSESTTLKKNKHATKPGDIQVIHKEDTGNTNYNKKRKERDDDDDTTNVSKIFKHNSFNKAHVTRLPSYILNQLGDKPNKTTSEAKRAKIIATTRFTVEDTKVRRNKPSNYLEESVYLNDDNVVEKKHTYSIKKPKVLPFIPTASTSDSGFTTNFRINVLPCETQFVAQATNVINYKKDFLHQQKMKKFHTFEKYKNQRNVKLSKF